MVCGQRNLGLERFGVDRLDGFSRLIEGEQTFDRAARGMLCLREEQRGPTVMAPWLAYLESVCVSPAHVREK